MKRIIFLMLILFIGINAQQQSKYANYPGLIFREVFNNSTDTYNNGGVPTAVTYSQSSAICVSANSSKIVFTKALKGTYTIRIRFNSISPIASAFLYDSNSRDLGNAGYIITDTPTHIIVPDGTTYVDGNASATISALTKEIVVSGITLKASSFFINSRYSSTLFNTASYDVVEIYNRALSASEIKNLYDGVSFKDVQPNASEVLGSELVMNGTMELNSNWSVVGSPSVNEQSAVQKYAGSYSWHVVGMNNEGIRSDNFTGHTVGNLYLVEGYIYLVSGSAVIKDQNNYLNGVSNRIITTGSWQRAYYYCNASNATAERIYAVADQDGTEFYVDNISVKQVLSASTPLLIDFNSTGGLVKDFTGKTITNTATTIKRSGSIWSANFDGSTSKLDYGNIDALTGDITICGWVNARGISATNPNRIIDNTKLQLILISATKRLDLYSDNTVAASSATNSILTGKWYFIIVTRTSSGITNFHIGDSKTSPTLSGTANQSSGTPTAGTTNITVGNRSVGDRTFNGLIPFLRVYKSILTLNQISALWSSTVGDYQ